MILPIVCCSSSIVALVLSVTLLPSITIKVSTKCSFDVPTFWISSLLGLGLLLLTGTETFTTIGTLLCSQSVNPLSIIVLFFSLSFISIYLGKTGFFESVSIYVLSRVKSSPKSFFITSYILVSFATLFTSNDVVILVLTPFIYHYTHNAGYPPLPYLIAQFFSANIWSALFYIGNPTNLYLAAYFDLDFATYLKSSFITVIFAGILNFVMLYRLSRTTLKRKPVDLPSIDSLAVEVDRPGVVIGCAHLIITIVFLIVGPYFSLDSSLVCFVGACSLLLCLIIRAVFSDFKFSAIFDVFAVLPWSVAPFLLSMFVQTLSLDKYQVTDRVAELIEHVNIGKGVWHEVGDIFLYGILSVIMVNLMNNLPMTLFFASVISIQKVFSPVSVFAVAFGSNIGANLTPIGSLAGVMFCQILEKLSLKITFKNFLGFGIRVSLVVVLCSLVVLSFHHVFGQF
ncbi:hypothetical protein GEMRC1_014163 [Eukaryota sp. GEM-RC1]